eukprot:COSAG01_NODE_78728_length_141_cov_82.666667_1_plen_37_part_01
MALPPPPAPDSTMPRTEAVQWGGPMACWRGAALRVLA